MPMGVIKFLKSVCQRSRRGVFIFGWNFKARGEGEGIFGVVVFRGVIFGGASRASNNTHPPHRSGGGVPQENSGVRAGFKINPTKSVLEPTKEEKNLGSWIYLKRGQLELPWERLKNLRKELGKI